MDCKTFTKLFTYLCVDGISDSFRKSVLNTLFQWGRLTLVLFCVCFSLHTTSVFGQAAVQAWAVRYNGTANGEDDARKVITDGVGNVIVAGASSSSTGTDIVTIKYNSAGVQQWLVRYKTSLSNNQNSTASVSEDKPYDLVTDAAGNIYVMGYALVGSDPAHEASITIKYDSKGVQQWAYVLSAEQGYPSFENADLQLDASGNVYLTTTQAGNMVTIKLSGNGGLVWRKDYANASGTALTVDGAGNVYVAGQINNTKSGFDFFTLKYSATGTLQWTKQLAPSNQRDVTKDIAVDAAGNVYVLGTSQADDFGDIITLKYSASGVQLWRKDYDAAPGYSRDQACRLLLDKDGNVIVAGASYNQTFETPFWEYSTIKYSASGVQQWVAREKLDYSGCNDMVLDAAGNVYVTGVADGQYATIKYNKSGAKQWAVFFTSGYTEYSNANALCLDPAGNVVVTGYSTAPNSFGDFLTIKYNNYGANPVFSGFAPTQVPVGAGVAIRGVNFKNVTAVRFNGVDATQISVESSELIIATVPQGASTGPIQVVTNGGSIQSSANLTLAPVSSQWQAKASMPTARSQHGAGLWGAQSKIVAFGGTNGTELNATEVFSIHAQTWTTGTAMPAPSRGLSYVTAADGQIYALGGYGLSSNRTQCYRYNPAANTWTAIASMPTAVWAAAATITNNGKIYVFGGQTSGGWLNQYTQVYDIASNTWSENFMPTPIMQHQAVTGYNGKIYLFGGRNATTGNLSDQVHIYDPASNNWSTGASMPVPKAQFAAVRSNDGRIYIIGGKGSSIPNVGPFFNSVEYYNPSNNTWQTGPSLPAPVSGLTVVNAYGNVFALGGNNGSFRNYNWQLILAPLAPASAVAKAVSATQIQVSWVDTSGNEERYEVERSQAASGPWAVIASLPKDAKVHTDENRIPGTVYYYRVRGGNSAGYSAYSQVVSAVTSGTRLAAARQSVETTADLQQFVASPNPFIDRVSLSFSLEEPAYTVLDVYDLKGVLVKRVYEGQAEAHRKYTFEVDGSGWQQGMYLSRLNTNGKSTHQKIVLSH